MKKQMELDDRTIRIIAESNPGDFAIYRIDSGKLVPLFVSESLAELSGMTLPEYSELTRDNAAAVILSVDQPQVAGRIAALLAGGGDADVTYRILHKNLGHIWVHAKGRVIGARNGCPVVLVSYSRSSSEAAGQSQLLNLTSAILYVVDKNTYEILFANDTALGFWGHGDYAGQTCYRYVNGCSEPCPWCSVPAMKNGTCHVDASYSPMQDRWFRIDCREIDWYGRAAVAISAEDVTEQQKQRQSIQADRDNLDAILGSIPGGVAVFSACGEELRLEYTNNGFYELHHGSRKYWIGIGENPLNWISDADRQAFSEEFGKVVSGEKQQGSSTYRIMGEDGKPHWVNNQFRRAYLRGGVQYYYASFVDMDDQIAAESARNEARRMYEAAVEATNLVVWEYDIPGHRVIMAENEFTEYDYRKFGLPKVTENAPQSLVPYIDDAYVDTFLEMYRKIDGGAPAASCEVWYKLKPGSEPRCEKISYMTVFDAEGKPVKAYGIGQNITAHKREEDSYKQTIRQIAQAAGNTLGAFSLNLTANWCGEGKSIYDFVLKQAEAGTADGYFLAFSNIVSDEENRKKALELFNREGLIRRFLRGETQVELEYPVRYRSGEIHWQRGVLNMMRNPNTGDIEAVTHALDIDRRKRSEQIAERVLNDRLDYTAILYPCSGMIDFYTVQQSITRVEAGKRYSYEEIRDYLRGNFVSPDDSAAFDRGTEMDTVLAAIRETGVCHCYYRRLQNGRQTYRHLQYNWLDQTQTAILAIQSDVTDSHEQEQRHLEEMRQALTAAEAANRAKTEFLSRMSHDIRTPLNGIIGMTYLAGEENNPPKTADCLEKIGLSSKFLLGLINDVLDMAKAESGVVELHPEPYDPQVFFSYLSSVIAPLCREKEIRFVVDAVPDTDVVPLIDPLRINQVFFNLLSNAVKFTPEGGTVTFYLREQRLPGGELAMESEVRDTGIGMSGEFQKVLFDPFTQESRSDNSENRGTGLGLAIVKKLLDRMGCTITVESGIGAGTVFRIRGTFPCVPEGAQERRETRTAESSDELLRGRHVLLCEDHPLNQEIANALLEAKKMVVTIADDGEQGVEKYLASTVGFYDIILMDIRMPVMDGYAATKAIRASGRPDAATVPIIAMTADAFADDVQKCLDAGMDGHVAKPVDPENLYDVLRNSMR